MPPQINKYHHITTLPAIPKSWVSIETEYDNNLLIPIQLPLINTNSTNICIDTRRVANSLTKKMIKSKSFDEKCQLHRVGSVTFKPLDLSLVGTRLPKIRSSPEINRHQSHSFEQSTDIIEISFPLEKMTRICTDNLNNVTNFLTLYVKYEKVRDIWIIDPFYSDIVNSYLRSVQLIFIGKRSETLGIISSEITSLARGSASLIVSFCDQKEILATKLLFDHKSTQSAI